MFRGRCGASSRHRGVASPEAVSYEKRRRAYDWGSSIVGVGGIRRIAGPRCTVLHNCSSFIWDIGRCSGKPGPPVKLRWQN